MKFTKMHGAGNNFIVLEDLDNRFKDLNLLAKVLCDRAFGIGGDGILVVKKSNTADIDMVIINADGSYAAMCGNGIRCFAKYVYENGIVNKELINIGTGDGIKIARLVVKDGVASEVTIDMGMPSFEPDKIPAITDKPIINKTINIQGKDYILNTMLMGVPHTVIIDKLNNYQVEEGKLIEKLSIFPEGTNVNFCEVLNKSEIRVKTWERGAGATLACGTGACASVIACNNLSLVEDKVLVHIPGGTLKIEVTTNGVLMTGPAVKVFQGETLEMNI
ncbi:diaminopimelate epimerase [Clostridium punense]|uniref:diaminopimelate epimerase n=1 Tax=Clostridium TaxID=1485 RepID=UPI0004CEEB1F|nr:diaminopimelate epimerase [Clostridium sp. BL8]